MKNSLLFIATLLVSTIMFAQAPPKMSYQAVIRDNSGQLVTNQNIGMQISILQGDPFGGPTVYEETQTAATNANGLVSLEIGTGTVTAGSALSSVDWSDGPYYIKTETDIAGGTNYTITGTNELLSVPYALHANTANTADSAIHTPSAIRRMSVDIVTNSPSPSDDYPIFLPPDTNYNMLIVSLRFVGPPTGGDTFTVTLPPASSFGFNRVMIINLEEYNSTVSSGFYFVKIVPYPFGDIIGGAASGNGILLNLATFVFDEPRSVRLYSDGGSIWQSY